MYIYIWGKRSGERNEKRRGVVLEMAQKYKKKAADEFSFYLTREIFGQTVNSSANIIFRVKIQWKGLNLQIRRK